MTREHCKDCCCAQVDDLMGAVRDEAALRSSQVEELEDLLNAANATIRRLLSSLDLADRKAREECVNLAAPFAICRCDVAYTSRGRHESNAQHEVVEDIIEAIRATIKP